MDINYIQSHKAMENAHFALEEGGVMILLAESTYRFCYFLEIGKISYYLGFKVT